MKVSTLSSRIAEETTPGNIYNIEGAIYIRVVEEKTPSNTYFGESKFIPFILAQDPSATNEKDSRPFRITYFRPTQECLEVPFIKFMLITIALQNIVVP